MIPCKPTSEHPPQWKKLFATSYVGIKEFAKRASDYSVSADNLNKIDALFPIQLSQQLLDNHPIDGPVLKQYLPNIQELNNPSGYTDDPVGDISATLQPGIIKKYKHRVLLITNNTCPIHCRYCFRKDFPYPETNPNTHQFESAISFCEKDKSINEVILSGGDPLSLEDHVLDTLFKSLEKIPHIKTIRIHTKFPSVYPERITQEFLVALKNCTLNKVCVFHINHPDEINHQFCDAVQKIKQTNTTTFNQSVLLNNVNDNPDILIELSNKLFAAGVVPYYLHMLDPAKGTHHFSVSTERAKSIIQQMKNNLPGYLVPKLAQEIPGQNSKIY
ncbi:MAG: KamA family radical SAM protein [Gammaproteobacteria bacterium]|nr:KamA family radical SAM protein [Gammaproteobacteria bacterium]